MSGNDAHAHTYANTDASGAPTGALERGRRILLALLVLAFAVHLVATAGRVPLNGDSYAGLVNDVAIPGYAAAARDGVVDPRRGLVYPPFVRLVHTSAATGKPACRRAT